MFCENSFSDSRFLFYIVFCKLLIRAGFSEIEPLDIIRRQILNLVPFIACFNPLHADIQIQGMYHFADQIKQIVFIFIGQGFGGKRAVNLNDIRP